MAVKGKDANYWVVITNQTQGITVTADLPEQVGVSMSSNYEGGDGLLMPQVGGVGAATAVGGDVVFKPFTKLVWRGTTPIEFSLALIFDAETNSRKDVHEIMSQLASLCLPDAKGNILTSPNPTRMSESYNKTSVAIGRQYMFDNVAMVSASPMSDSRLTSDGSPIAGAIEVSFQTETVFSKDDWFAATGVGPSGKSAANAVANNPEVSNFIKTPVAKAQSLLRTFGF